MNNKWISVEKDLPLDRQAVLVIQNPKTTATRKSLYAVYDEKSKRFRDAGFSHDGIHLGIAYWSDIIFWQPMPSTETEELSDELIKEIKDVLCEANNQINYLHEKFKETGSGNAVLNKLDRIIKLLNNQK